jgi:hypothetical protein
LGSRRSRRVKEEEEDAEGGAERQGRFRTEWVTEDERESEM